jgi:hypothetical protein
LEKPLAEKGRACCPASNEKKIRALPFCYFLLFAAPLQSWAEADHSLPRIARLDNRDAVFKQYLEDVEASRRYFFRPGISQKELAEFITIYSYIPSPEDEIIGLAARCNVPYGSLASINRFSHPEDLQNGAVMLFPSMRGLFIPETPGTDLERLLASSREGGVALNINGEKFRFFPGVDFNQTERIFFLNRGFRFPLRDFRISSPYGFRVNPVTGKQGVHNGVDLAAPEGTPVFAVREGKVSAVGEDPVFGLFVIISHQNNWVSLYGHLSKIESHLNQELKSGNLIGRVGSTGQSTGPHLHFELRQNGQARDPGRLLRLFQHPGG